VLVGRPGRPEVAGVEELEIVADAGSAFDKGFLDIPRRRRHTPAWYWCLGLVMPPSLSLPRSSAPVSGGPSLGAEGRIRAEQLRARSTHTGSEIFGSKPPHACLSLRNHSVSVVAAFSTAENSIPEVESTPHSLHKNETPCLLTLKDDIS